MRLFLNGLAASAGGGLTYLRNVIPQLSRASGVETTVLLNPQLRGEFGQLPQVEFIDAGAPAGAMRRLLYEQRVIPDLVRQQRAEILVSAGNFALWNSPAPQILLSRNSLYTSADFYRDLRARGDYRVFADTLIKGWFARQSIQRAEVTIAPSEAFARDLSDWAGKNVLALHHGFDRDAFTRDATPLPESIRSQLDRAQDAVRLLFVSHYNYYRNFEILFRSLPILQKRLNGRKVKLFLTCRLQSSENPGSYRAETASSLLNSLRAQDAVAELGTIPYGSLHHLYRGCQIYVTPAYTESFAHPLVEAMSSGLPIVASDLPVHQEICRESALYFPRFSAEALAECVLKVHSSAVLTEELSRKGLARSKDFRWDRHVQKLVAIAGELGKERPKAA